MTVLSLWKGQIPPAKPTPRREVMEAAVKAVAEKHGVTLEDIMGRSKRRHIAWARQEAMHELYALGWLSMPRIGQYLGGLDHTSVLYGIRRHKERTPNPLEAQAA